MKPDAEKVTTRTPAYGAFNSGKAGAGLGAARCSVSVEVIEAKAAEADAKAKWHEDSGYSEEAEYFRGWAYGLRDLIKPPSRRGRKPRTPNDSSSATAER